MKYLPLSTEEKEELLTELGIDSVDELFRSIPVSLRKETSNALANPMSELEIDEFFRVSQSIRTTPISFIGGNGHHHYIPSIIDPLISRGEFLTAYTPYQAEVSQGTLQAMFEFQSMMADLMGVEVSNASLYDGSTAMIEAALMASRITKKEKILVSSQIHPEYLETLQTYTKTGVLTYELVASDQNGKLDLDALKKRVSSGDIAAVIVQSPNYGGVIEDLSSIAPVIKGHNGLLVAVTTEALSLPLLKSPGSLGADIVCGEGQSLGIPVSFGGPWLGFIGTSTKYMRNLPGRLVGETKDLEGRRAFVVTLAAREQHIRRAKATSNICTNQGLMTLRATIYMSVMGKQGIVRAAERSAKFAHLARRRIGKTVKVLHPDAPIFNEFVIETPVPARAIFRHCMEKERIAPGNIIGENRLLCSFNETMSPALIELWAKTIEEACRS